MPARLPREAGRRPRTSPLPVLLTACLLAGGAAPAFAQQDGQPARAITALGRIEPAGGVIRVAGPSFPVVVLTELAVEEGDLLDEGQLIARLDSHPRHLANVDAMKAELAEAQREVDRTRQLQKGRAASQAAQESAEAALAVARARLAAARADLALSEVHAPIAGRVLAVHARAGERVGPEGIIELGRTDEMYAIAEVYETDIGRVRRGQHAEITSPALPAPISGTVEQIGLMVAKMDVLDTDPVARTDARVVEVKIRLDGAADEADDDVGRLTYLQVKVAITP